MQCVCSVGFLGTNIKLPFVQLVELGGSLDDWFLGDGIYARGELGLWKEDPKLPSLSCHNFVPRGWQLNGGYKDKEETISALIRRKENITQTITKLEAE